MTVDLDGILARICFRPFHHHDKDLINHFLPFGNPAIMNRMGFDRGKLFSFFFCTEYAVRHFERIVSADSYNTNSRRRHRCGHCGNCIIQMKSCHCFQSFLKPLFLGIPVFRSTFFLSFRMALNSSILAENQKRRYPVFYTGTVFLHIFYAFLSFRRYNNVAIWLAALAVGLHKFISLQCRVDDSSLVRIHRL